MYRKLDNYWDYFNESIDYVTIKSGHWWIGDLDYRIIWNDERECIQINFQGTVDWRDWISNFTFPAAPYGVVDYNSELTNEVEHIKMWVARGWMTMYKLGKHTIRDQINALLTEHPNCVIEVIGHSLGGAMSQLCAQDIYFNFNIKPILITFGSPNPWFGKQTLLYVSQAIDWDNSFQFDNVNDPVPRCPPLFGYKKIKPVEVGNEKFNFFKMIFKAPYYHMQYGDPNIYNLIEI